ncbi:MAG: tetratricopeptide repeat protein [Spirochaetia bacterium]|nr:tetratricopeptide repeat protein [Spirochaetia bacterium]
MSARHSLPDSVSFISVPPQLATSFSGFTVDPSIPLPVELSAAGDLSSLGWEMIVSGMLRVLAYQPDHVHAAYYRDFVLAVKPDIAGELSQTGILKARNGDHELAEEIFLALRGLYPEAPEPLLNLAVLYEDMADALERTGKPEDADEERERAFGCYKGILAMDPPFPEGWLNAGYFHLKSRNYDKAREIFEFYCTLGQDEDKTAKAREIAARLATRSGADALFKEAYDYIRMGDEERGIAKALEFTQAQPSVWNGWFLVGWGRRRLERWADARDAFIRAMELGADEVDILNELAICEMELGLMDQSRQRLERALRKEPDNVKIISNLGVVARRQGRLDEAAGFFRTVLEFEPGDQLASDQLAELGQDGAAH